MDKNTEPKFVGKSMNEENMKKIELSLKECAMLKPKVIKCPNCGNILINVFSDARGHFRTKCHHCKAAYAINIDYFLEKS